MKWAFTFYFLFISQLLLAQQPDYTLKENSAWWFGVGIAGSPGTGSAGLNFNAGAPAPISILSDAGGYSEAQAAVCDTGGNFLFYTEGTFVLNRNGNFMPHGDSLVGDAALYFLESQAAATAGVLDPTSSCVQGAVITPVSGNPNSYYIFSLTSGEFYNQNGNTPVVSKGMAGELFYSVVDMTLDSGRGDVVTTQRGIFLDSNLAESMVAVAGTHCDVWILVHAFDAPVVYAFNVNANGVNPVPVVSNCGNFSGLSTYENASGMRVSPNRKKLVVCSNAGAELCDFDPATGIVSNAMVFNVPQFSGAPAVYQACFSPDNSKLYIVYAAAARFLQFDLTDPTFQTYTQIGGGLAKYCYDPEIGLDGKIYIQSLGGNNSIDCIASPNLAGTACNLIQNAVSLPSSFIGTDDLHTPYVKPLRDTSYVNDLDTVLCSQSGSLVLHAPPGFDNYLWNTNSTDSTIIAKETGVYISMSDSYCETRYDTFSIKKVSLSFSLGLDSNYCSSAPVTLTVSLPNANYLWQDGSTNSSYTVTQSGAYSVQVKDSGCTYADTINIGLINVHQDLGDDTIICADKGPVQMTLIANVPEGASATWSTGSTDTTIAIDTGGIYWVNVTDAGCQGSDTINIQTQICNCVVSVLCLNLVA